MEELRKNNEKEFFYQVFKSKSRQHMSKFYKITNCSRKYYEKYLFSNCCDKKVLEYGCGTGSYAFNLAKHGATVLGIDISEIGIKMAKVKSKKTNLKNVSFLVMDAESLQIEDNFFDIICGSGILHHLNLNKSLNEIVRVLKPNGKAIFIEPLGLNPFINFYRYLTPAMRTKNEHPLKTKDLKLIKNYFSHVNYKFFHLSSLLAVPFCNYRKFSSMLILLDKFDQKLFRYIPFIKLMSWQVVITLKEPIKSF
ncbi:class I SAM-dependent methyltransferase [Patescibacteria group bacterium]|nr:class I SAM-dependent methyltransferase [Patescibacteria group bacterium]